MGVYRWLVLLKDILFLSWFLIEFVIDYLVLQEVYGILFRDPCSCSKCKYRRMFRWVYLWIMNLPMMFKILQVLLRKIGRKNITIHGAYYSLFYYFPIASLGHRFYIYWFRMNQIGYDQHMRKLAQVIKNKGMKNWDQELQNFIFCSKERKKLQKKISARIILEPSFNCLIKGTVKSIVMFIFNIFNWIFGSKVKEEVSI